VIIKELIKLMRFTILPVISVFVAIFNEILKLARSYGGTSHCLRSKARKMISTAMIIDLIAILSSGT